MTWHNYHDHYQGEDHTVAGTVKLWKDLESPQLGNTRDLIVHLPPSYEAGDTRYPVIYMQDGQNLFDQATSFAGEWQVDETMQLLAEEGIEAIVVGIPNTGPQRMDEYSPFRDPKHGGGKGDQYLTFVTDTVKPLIDQSFRTKPDRQHTGIIGSSMGGLISLYALFCFPKHFGFVGAMSPSLWFAQGAMLNYAKRRPFLGGKIYLDMGTLEGSRAAIQPPWFRTVLRRSATQDGLMYDLLVEKGYRPEKTILYVEELGGKHEEAAWARRLPNVMRFLLGQQQVSVVSNW